MSFKRLTLFLLFAISVFWGGDVSAQSRNRLYMQYIDTYKDLAIRHHTSQYYSGSGPIRIWRWKRNIGA